MTNSPLIAVPGSPADEETIQFNNKTQKNNNIEVEDVKNKNETTVFINENEKKDDANHDDDDDDDEDEKNFFQKHKKLLLILAMILFLCGIVIFARYGLSLYN